MNQNGGYCKTIRWRSQSTELNIKLGIPCRRALCPGMALSRKNLSVCALYCPSPLLPSILSDAITQSSQDCQGSVGGAVVPHVHHFLVERQEHTHVHTCTHTYMHTCTHMQTHAHRRTQAHTDAHMHKHTHACTYMLWSKVDDFQEPSHSYASQLLGMNGGGEGQ